MERKQFICFEFKKMDHVIVRQLKKRLTEAGFDEVTIMHGHILGYLYKNRDKKIYQKDIANSFGIGKSSVTNILKLMEKKGYLKCVPDEHDGRLKRIVITRRGEEIQLETMKVIDKLHDDIEAGITDEERNIFFGMINKMKNNVHQMNKEEEQC